MDTLQATRSGQRNRKGRKGRKGQKVLWGEEGA